MATPSPNSSALLSYNATFQVLICLECHYAIQKSAVPSHLLRHKIYRGDRQRLLAQVAQHDLREPEDVREPPAGSPPVRGLPVLEGYRCMVDECGCLLASPKRMKRHWSEAHGSQTGDAVPDLPSFAIAVEMQTFFRGTKLRYFEVNSRLSGPSGSGTERETGQESYDRMDSEPYQATPTGSWPQTRSGLRIDLGSLRYFHHFVTTTSHTLPNADSSPYAAHYWQQDVISQALGRQWLMSGLLAISAFHLATISSEEGDMQTHTRNAQELSTAYRNAFEQMRRHEESEALITSGRHVQGLLDCAQQASLAATNGSNTLDTILAMLKSCPSGAAQLDSSANNKPPSALVDALGALHLRMAEAFEKPDDARDFLATLSAIAALTKCIQISFASDQTEVVWHGMGSWLAKLTDHYQQLILKREPAALVVLAYWAAALVKRAETYGCWFLRGSSHAILAHVAVCLSTESRQVQSLVDGLCE